MLKATYWISVVSVPILLVSAGCSVGPRQFSSAKRAIPPERLMAMARTFERQGHYAQAKTAYLQILASQPDYPEARQNLDTLLANEGSPERLKSLNNSRDPRQQIIAKAKTAEFEARELALREKEASLREKEASLKIAAAESRSGTTKVRHETTERPRIRHVESAATTEPSDSSPVIALQEAADDRSEIAIKRSEIAVKPAVSSRIRSEEARLSEPLNAFAEESSETEEPLASDASLNSSPVPEPRVADLTDLKSADEASAPEIAQSSRAANITFDSETKTESQKISDPVNEDGSEDWDLAQTRQGAELRSTPEFSSPAETDDALKTPADEPGDEIQFEKPIVRTLQLADSSLQHFFGPFNAGMVLEVRANRDQFQSKLAKLVSDQGADCEVRSRAVFLLGSIGPAAVDVVPALRREMHYDADEYLRVDLCEAILKIQPEDEDAIKVLVDSLKETDENLRWIAAFALRNAVSPRTTFVIDSLLESLDTQDLKLRRMIFLTLAEFGPAAEKAIPQLEAALESPDAATREVAKASLACIAPNRKTTMSIQKTKHLNEVTANR